MHSNESWQRIYDVTVEQTSSIWIAKVGLIVDASNETLDASQ